AVGCFVNNAVETGGDGEICVNNANGLQVLIATNNDTRNLQSARLPTSATIRRSQKISVVTDCQARAVVEHFQIAKLDSANAVIEHSPRQTAVRCLENKTALSNDCADLIVRKRDVPTRGQST